MLQIQIHVLSYYFFCKESIERRRGRTQERDPPWLWNPGQTSPEVQNRGISGLTKMADVLQKLKKSYCVAQVKLHPSQRQSEISFRYSLSSKHTSVLIYDENDPGATTGKTNMVVRLMVVRIWQYCNAVQTSAIYQSIQELKLNYMSRCTTVFCLHESRQTENVEIVCVKHCIILCT